MDNINQPYSIYGSNNAYPQTENNGGYNSENNNIYSSTEGNIYCLANNTIYSEANNNINSQNNENFAPPKNNQKYVPSIYGNVYVPPPLNPPLYPPQVSGEIPVYVPQVSAEIKSDIPQVNLNVASPGENINSFNVTNPIYTSSNQTNNPNQIMIEPSSPLIPPSSVESINSIKELNCCQKCCTIIFVVFLGFQSLFCIIMNPIIENYDLKGFLSLDFISLFYCILICVSLINNRWIRVIVTTFSIIAFIGGLVSSIFEILFLENLKYSVTKNKDMIGGFIACSYLRIFLYFFIMNTIFYNYWGITFCKCNNCGSSFHHHSGISTTYHHSKPFHSKPHHSKPFHSKPHKSKPFHSKPHKPFHSKPHKS